MGMCTANKPPWLFGWRAKFAPGSVTAATTAQIVEDDDVAFAENTLSRSFLGPNPRPGSRFVFTHA